MVSPNKILNTIAIVIMIGAFFMAFFMPVVHDYNFYIEDWNFILHGTERSLDQWKTPIAYGPIYYIFAYLYKIYFKIPHLLMILAWVVSSLIILKLLKEKRKKVYYLFWVLMFLNPLIWFFCVYYGNIDIMVSSFVLMTFYYYDKKKFFISGLYLGLAILLKVFPIILIPYFLLYKRKMNWMFFKSITSVLIFGILIFLFFSNQNLVTNLIYQAERESSSLSVFRYLRGNYSILKLFTNSPNADSISIYLIGITSLINIWFFLKYRSNYLITALLGLTLLFTFHKVGNHQYYITILYVIGFIYLKYINDKKKHITRQFKIVYLVFVLFISVIPLIEFMIRHIFKSWALAYHEIVGLPMFIISIIFILTNYKLLYLNLKKGDEIIF